MVAVPLSGRARPRIMRRVVVLPAPFGPRNPVTPPGCTSKLRSSTARFGPKCFVRLRTWITARPFESLRPKLPAIEVLPRK